MEKQIFHLPDLTCASCVPEIEQVMRQQEGVIWAVVNFAAREATIHFDPVEFNSFRLMQAMRPFEVQLTAGDGLPAFSAAGRAARVPLPDLKAWMRAKRRSLFLRARALIYKTPFCSPVRH